MSTKFFRACMLLVVLIQIVMLLILGLMMFSKNILPDVHVPFWAAALSVCANFTMIVVIARFLWYQDQYWAMMNEFNPIVARIRDVMNVK